MFWWREPKERTFGATSGVTVTVIETGDNAYYRVTPRQDASRSGQADSDLLCEEETECIVEGL